MEKGASGRRGRGEEGGGGTHTDRQPDTQNKTTRTKQKKKEKKKGRNIIVPDPRRLADKRKIRFVQFAVHVVQANNENSETD